MPCMSRQVINMRRWPVHLLYLSFFLYLLIHLLFLEAYPSVNRGGDESWFMDYSITFLKTGELKGSIFSLTPLNEPGILNAYVYNGLLSLLFLLTGPGIVWGRLLSLVAGLLVLYLVYLMGKELNNPLAGSLGALLLSVSIYFGIICTELRPEALFTLIFCLSMLFFIKFLKRGRPFYLFLSSLFSASLIWIHLNAIVVCLALILAYGIFYRKVISKNTLYLFGGFFVISGIFLITNYLPLKDRAFSSFSTVHLNYMPPLLKGDLKAYLITIIRAILFDGYKHFFGGPSRTYMNYVPIFIFFITGLIVFVLGLLYGRDRESKRSIMIPLILCLCLYASSVLLSLQICQQVYLGYFMPFIALILSMCLLELKRATEKKRILKGYLIEALVLIILLVSIADYILTGLRFRSYAREFNSLLQEISSSIPEGSSVLGGSMYYEALLKKDLRLHTYLFMQNSCPDFRQSLRTLRPGYVIWDNVFDYLASFWCYEPYRDKIKALLKENSEVIKDVTIRYPFVFEAREIEMNVVVYKLKPDI